MAMDNDWLEESDCCFDEGPCDLNGRPLKSYSSTELGREGERIAANYLELRGFEILERNWRCRAGEADIIAIAPDDDPNALPGTVVLVEVKTRISLDGDDEAIPELSVNKAKRNRYRNIALKYVSDRPEVQSLRFDVIAIQVLGDGCARLRHLCSAYCWEEG